MPCQRGTDSISFLLSAICLKAKVRFSRYAGTASNKESSRESKRLVQRIEVDMARGKKHREIRQSPPLGRVLAVLRTTLGLTQSDLAQVSGVKRASISEYEREVSTPDASTLERLLSAMSFRWTALDLGSWFLERLLIDCRLPQGEDARGGTASPLATASTLATRLSADVRMASQTAARLSQLVLMLQDAKRTEEHSAARGASGARDRQAAKVLWSHLKTLARREQLAALQAAPAGEQWAICELLCLESQRLCGEDPTKAASICELALAAAELAEGDEAIHARLRGFAWAHLGNAWRAQGDLQEAERAFSSAEDFWRIGEGAVDGLLEEGLIFALKASLKRAQRRFDEARTLLDRASILASTPTFQIQVLVSKAKLLAEIGELEEAAAILENVKEAVSPEEEARILFPIWHNLADTLSKLERFVDAAALLPEARMLCLKAGGELNRIRLMWTEGRIVAGLGPVAEGIATLARVRGEYASREMAYDTALVSLELAVLYAREGWTEQVKNLARHMTPIFRAHAIHREALAALTLFRQAAEREEVTVGFAREVLAYLRRARYNPVLQFEGAASPSK
jgi:tetratricopeptide (TPR) repeat protein/DNA-binding XRE family transcriptional regulator